MTNLTISLPGLDMKNPIMPASGTFGFGELYQDLYDYNCLGALVLKSTTLKARKGNEGNRFYSLKNSALNAVGLKNPGVDRVVKDKLPPLRQYKSPVIGSVAGETEEEFVEVARKLSQSDVISALELNLSCPNVKEGGLTFGVEPKSVERITKSVKQVVAVPVYVKLTPNVTDIVSIAKAAEAGGADGISLINTVLSMTIDVNSRKPTLGNTMGGLSGEGIFPIAVRMVYQVSQAVNIPVIGIGGVQSADDALQMLLAGASAVAVGTASYKNPLVMKDIIADLPIRMKELGIESIETLIQEVKEGRLRG